MMIVNQRFWTDNGTSGAFIVGNRILGGAEQRKRGWARGAIGTRTAHAGRTAVTSISRRRLGHTTPSMMESMAAGWCG